MLGKKNKIVSYRVPDSIWEIRQKFYKKVKGRVGNRIKDTDLPRAFWFVLYEKPKLAKMFINEISEFLIVRW